MRTNSIAEIKANLALIYAAKEMNRLRTQKGKEKEVYIAPSVPYYKVWDNYIGDWVIVPRRLSLS